MSNLPTGVITRTRGMSPKCMAAKKAMFAYISRLELPEGVKAIPLTRKMYTLVDAADYDFLMQWNWYAKTGEGNSFYASRSSKIRDENGNWKQKIIGMHNALMNPPQGMEVDHINADPLDNRRSNLRVCSHPQNMANIRGQKVSTSPYKGVSWHKHRNRWQATIKINFKAKHLGLFDDVAEAARAYNKAALEHHGEFARLNPVEAL